MQIEWIYKLAETALMYAILVDELVKDKERNTQWFINWLDKLNKISVK